MTTQKITTMKTSMLTGLALFFAFSMVCRANLGETETQCMAKYGHEFDVQDNLGFDVVGDKAASFNLKTSKGSFVINITFLNGVAALEKMTSADLSRDISEDQKAAILQSESAGLKWDKQGTTYRTDRSDVTSGMERWLRSDGATAICWMSGKLTLKHGWGEIDLSTKQYASAQRGVDQQDGAR
jgi:hypothetical protein